MKTHVVKYPGSIKKALLTLDDLSPHKEYSILSKAGLPEGTLFDYAGVKNEEGFGHTIFTILLPDGEAFSGFAIKKRGDKDDTETAACIAAGRAVAVWKAQGVKNNPLHKDVLKHLYGVRVDDVISAMMESGILLCNRKGNRTIVTT